MASILVVCTGNVCRSPIAAGFLASGLERRFGSAAPRVVSAGTHGWDGSGAMPESVRAAAEREVDISGHLARKLTIADIEGADLILGMAGEHREAVVAAEPGAAARTFTLKELVRLLEALPPASGRGTIDRDALRDRLAAADEASREGFEGNPHDEDVADPLGMPEASFRAVAWDLDEWCTRLIDSLAGRAPARASIWDEEESS